MEILGIGPTELIFILVLALIIFGPKDLEKAGRTLGRSLYKLIKSETWQTLTQTSKRIRTLPNDLIKQAEREVLQEKVDSGAVKSDAWMQDPRIHPGAVKPSAQTPAPEVTSVPPTKPDDKPVTDPGTSPADQPKSE